jgi:hypothetical protein
MKQRLLVVLGIIALVHLVGHPGAHAQMNQQPDTTKIFLLDVPKVATHLQLNASQVTEVSAFIGQI